MRPRAGKSGSGIREAQPQGRENRQGTLAVPAARRHGGTQRDPEFVGRGEGWDRARFRPMRTRWFKPSCSLRRHGDAIERTTTKIGLPKHGMSLHSRRIWCCDNLFGRGCLVVALALIRSAICVADASVGVHDVFVPPCDFEAKPYASAPGHLDVGASI